ncbi:MAG: HAD-IIIA family hydrolase [Cytophagales bacterium]|nr:MAG: HAD-IIIA family hydrolase [Cytophagales bacterium]TAF61248.1 MAG: HAD-IIIA family hydrolase [Cytophagales bacterium]
MFLDPQKALAAKKIKAFVFDVDGVLTDSGIMYDDNGTEYKRFNAKDGLIIRALPRLGLYTGCITGRNSGVVKHRMDELKVTFQYHGISKKQEVYEKIKQDYQLKDEEIAYIGDDLNDLPILTQCGLRACPQDANLHWLVPYIDFVCKKNGGSGAVREFAEAILAEQGRLEDLKALFWKP